MAQAVISVRIRDKDYRLIGEATNYISLTATIRFNEVGEWSMDVPGEAPEVKLLLLSENPAGGIVIYRDDRLFFSGPIWAHTWTMDATTGYPVLTVAGGCDNVVLTKRLVYPDPEQRTGVTPGSNYYQVASTDTESIMRDLVAKNLAVTAPLVDRRFPGLTQDANGHRGRVQPASTFRFDRLDEALKRYAQLAPSDAAVDSQGTITNPGDETQILGYRVLQIGQGLQFQVYPLTVQRHVRFSFDLANLSKADYVTQGPTATFAVVGSGGQADSTGKNIAADISVFSRADESYPGRSEIYTDGGSLEAATDTTTAINQVGLNALSDGAGQVSASVVAIDTNRMVYGVDYDLGDYVSVELPFLSFTSPIRSVTLTHTGGDGERVELGIGTAKGQYSAKATGTSAKVAELSGFARFKAIFGG